MDGLITYQDNMQQPLHVSASANPELHCDGSVQLHNKRIRLHGTGLVLLK